MKSSCVITIQLNTLTDVQYEMTVGGAFVYVCERDRGPRRPRYNGVAVYDKFHPFSLDIVTHTGKFCY